MKESRKVTETIIKFLESYMKEKNINKMVLAEKLEISKYLVYNWLGKKRYYISSKDIKKIVNLCNISLDSLFRINPSIKVENSDPNLNPNDLFIYILKKALKKRNHTKPDVVKRLRVSSGRVYHWFSLDRKVSIEAMVQLAIIYGVSLDSIFLRDSYSE